jgi:ABC-type dipeptide/oligopeptide/nickel transport system permease subunit
MMQVRALYYNYFVFLHGYEPTHLFGADAQGYDIFVRLACGVRLSLLLFALVSVVNLTIGTFLRGD